MSFAARIVCTFCPAITTRRHNDEGGGQRDAGFDGSLPTDSRLAILPGTSHYVALANPQIASLVSSFLGAGG